MQPGKRPRPDEVELVGKWISRDGAVRGDDTCERIEWLTTAYLRQVATDASGWETLFVDPEDGRYWERTYRDGASHGGGPPRMHVITPEAARAKYRLEADHDEA